MTYCNIDDELVRFVLMCVFRLNNLLTYIVVISSLFQCMPFLVRRGGNILAGAFALRL